jgi:hypothetical protein
VIVTKLLHDRTMNRLLGLLGCASVLVACGNEVVIEGQNEAAGGGNGSASSSSTSSSSTSSSSTTGGTSTVCTPKDDGTVPSEASCKDLDRLVLVNPAISGDTDGDGLVEAGETASLTVIMKDVSGYGFNWYPGVKFASKDPAVNVEADTWYYAILACTEQPATATIKVAPDAAPGTIVTVRARISMLNHECPDAFTIEIPIKVQ